MSPRKGWVTPETIPATLRCRTLFIPDDDLIRAAVNGALSELIYAQNWEQLGAVTPGQMASAMALMWTDYVNSECVEVMVTKRWIWQHREPANTGGGSTLAANSQDVPFPDSRYSDGGEVTLAVNTFTLQPGKYIIQGWHLVFGTGDCNLQLNWQGGGTPSNQFGKSVATGTTLDATLEFFAAADLPNSATFVVRVRTSAANAGDGLGRVVNEAGIDEVYGEIMFTRIGDL